MLLPVALLGAGTRVFGCSTPVYRYALENWPPDPYDLIVTCAAAEEEGIRQRMTRVFEAEEDSIPNVAVRFRRPEEGVSGAPQLEVRFPYCPQEIPSVWRGPLNDDSLRRILDSPARRALAAALVKDATAVFLFLESGRKEADREARARLRGVLDKLSRNLILPPQPEDMGMEEEGKEGPSVSFPILDVRRDDPEEEFLRDLLLATEEDLANLHEPMAFPVFGRGRALFALVGAGINEEVIADACIFLINGCSCQVKAQNPGLDILMRAAWDKALGMLPYEEVELPPLAGVAPAAAAAAETEEVGEANRAPEAQAAVETPPVCSPPPAEPPEPVGEPQTSMPRVRRAVLFAIGLGLVVLACGTIVVLLRGARQR